MKFSKIFSMAAAASMAVGAFADAANVLVSFSTTSDKYADGSTVKDGEWYALCWSADESFDGLNLDCAPKNPDNNAEKVLILAPLAENGRCPSVVFQIDSKEAPTGGNYFVYLLDTRNADGTVSGVKTTVDGRRVPENVVNGSAVAQSYAASSAEGAKIASAGASSAAVGTEGWAAVQPKIEGFELVGDARVKITVVGMMSGLNYKVSMGSDVGNMKTTEIAISDKEDGKVSFYVTDKDARFFKVVAE
jgi:hypothetical protein